MIVKRKGWLVPLSIFILLIPCIVYGGVSMNAVVTGDISMSIMKTAQFSVDDWLSEPNLWIVTVMNTPESSTDLVDVVDATINVSINSTQFPDIIKGDLRIISVPKQGPYANLGYHYYSSSLRNTPLTPGESMVFNNTQLQGSEAMIGEEGAAGGDVKWNSQFRNEVLRIGVLPEGTYTLRFVLRGMYSDGTTFSGIEYRDSFQVRNPSPPELSTPPDNADDVVSIPRFTWQRPRVSDLSSPMRPNDKIDIYYNFSLWKMFERSGAEIQEEDAIGRIPIFRVRGLTREALDFDPNTSREELVSGRKYCWQVQALDGVGRPITTANNGNSDVWEFTVRFSPPVINEPIQVTPQLSFSWTAAQVSGTQVLYRIRISENEDFTGGYREDGIVLTSFTYPDNAPMVLNVNTTYYLELQTTDERGIPLGKPITTTFRIPVGEILLRSPADATIISTSIPTFSWNGDARSYVIVVRDTESDWVFTSEAVTTTTYTYPNEDLVPGKNYAWQVFPATPHGDPSETGGSEIWHFHLAAKDQVTLVSPVNVTLDTILPVFTWNEFTLGSGESAANYTIIIENESGSTVQSATVTATTYQYPPDATQLLYNAKYLWSVNATDANGFEIGKRSEQVFFMTPSVQISDESNVTVDELNATLQAVLADSPEFATLQNMVLVNVTEGGAEISPTDALNLLKTFNIVRVSKR